MQTTPLVTILIPVFNGEPYLKECLDSALNQTFTDFECLIIDDASTDGSVALAKSFTDPRIRLAENEHNMGGPGVRNQGFHLARGKYVAFLDCDDISVPDRIEKQVAFMEANPAVGLCGGYVRLMAEEGTLTDSVLECPTGPEAIARYLAVDCTLFNSTLITRKSVVIDNSVYHDPTYKAADDMDWFIRMAKVTTLANIPEVFTFRRVHRQQETHRRRFISRRNTINLHMGLMLEEIKKFCPDVQQEIKPVTPAMTEVTFFQNMLVIDQLMGNWPAPPEEETEAFLVYNTLKTHFNYMWLDIANCLPKYSLSIFRIIKRSGFFKSLPVAVQVGIWAKSVVGFGRRRPGGISRARTF